MDVVMLARMQFALTVAFHYIFPPLTIGMAWLVLWFQTLAIKKGETIYDEMAHFWIKLFAITFALGVATGITMEFQFGTNWAAYSRFVGDIFGAPLAAEGIFAFFLESTFLGIMLYGEKRVSRRVYWFSSLMVALGSTLSAFWIVVANSWQQTPAGFKLVGGRAEMVDFLAVLFNPSCLNRFFHVICGALIVGSFFILGISAHYLLHGRFTDFARRSLKHALILAFISSLLTVLVGHGHAVQVAATQPEKMAAFEGLWDSQSHAPLMIVGLPDAEHQTNYFSLAIPGGLSFLLGIPFDTSVKGLKDFAPEDRPPVMLSFLSFHAMVVMGGYMLLFTLLGIFLLPRGHVYANRHFLRLAVLSIPIPFVANEVGWMAAEVGRQPWIVYHLMRTEHALSVSVPAWQIVISIALFVVVYSLLFGVWIYLIRHLVAKGPHAALKNQAAQPA